MIICIIIKMHCKRQMQDLHVVFTACTLEDPTALPQRCHSALFNTLKTNASAWRSMRLQSAHTALLATAQRAPRRSAFFLERCGNAVRTPLWCDRGLN